MKTKITTCIVLVLMLLSGISQAQKRDRAKNMQRATIQFTDAQQKELRAAKVQFAKATIDVKNELNELKAYQRTLMSAENLNEKKVFENIDNITALSKQIMKERINICLLTSKFMDEETGMYNQYYSHRQGRRGHAITNGCGMMQRGRGQMQRNGKYGYNNQRFDRETCTLNSYNNACSRINSLGLSDDQQEKMKTMKVAHLKASQNLREEIQELRLKQKHLLNDETPNKTEIYLNIDRISSIKNQLAKESVARQQDIRNILDDDQLVLFLSKPYKMKNNRRARRHRFS